MRIGIIGAGNIGTNCAIQFLAGGHETMLSFSRDHDALVDRARDLGDGTHVGTPAGAVDFADVVVISVPWPVLDLALWQAGPLHSKIVVDTTNQFVPGGLADLAGQTAARHNADRMLGARYTKSFNTITASFQRRVAGRPDGDRLVQWLCGEDDATKSVVAGLITDAGYAPGDLGGLDTCAAMEPPRRPGAVYGEEYRAVDTVAVLDAVRSDHRIPAPPSYQT